MNKLYAFSIYVILILFLILYFTLSFHSRLAGDDFYYLWLKNTYGSWDGMLYQYKQWSGRWSAHFVGCKLISLWNNPFFLPALNFLSLGLLYFSLKSGLEKIIIALKISLDKFLIPVFTLLLITTFFFVSYSIGETWFWYIIILTYLWSIIAFILLLSLSLSPENNILTYILIVLCASFIGGASESYALIFLFVLFAILVSRRGNRFKNKINFVDYKLIIAIIILALSFSFSVFAPGTEIRHSLLPHTSIIEKLLVAIKAYIKYFIVFLPDKIGFLILFSFPWLYFGARYLKTIIEKNNIIKLIKRISLVFLILLAIMFLPTSFIMSETGPDRALSIISMMTTIYFAIIFSLLGLLLDLNKKVNRIILNGISIISIIVLIYTVYSQYNIGKKFANACDERMNDIEKAKENRFTGVLELKKIPASGMLYWDEISLDTSYYTNKHLKIGLGLSFQVKLKKEK